MRFGPLVMALFLMTCSELVHGQGATDVRPGKPWTTVDGQPIQAHSGGLLKIGDTWYWIGENKTLGSDFDANSCYSSNDLVHWRFVNDTLKVQADGDLGPHRIVERPKILYNAKTRMYVQYMHIDDPKYQEA